MLAIHNLFYMVDTNRAPLSPTMDRLIYTDVRIQDGKGGVTIDGSGSASELILKLIKTFDLSTWQDNGDLMGRESLNAVINRTLR